MDDRQKPDGIVLTEAQKKSRRQRSIAIALALGVLVVLFFAVTIVKGPGVLVRPLSRHGEPSEPASGLRRRENVIAPRPDPRRGGGGNLRLRRGFHGGCRLRGGAVL